MHGSAENVIPIAESIEFLEAERDDPSPVPPQKVAFSVRDVATLLGLHRNTVYGQIKDGKIPVVYVGTKPLIPRRWIEDTFGLVPPTFTPVHRVPSR